MSAEFEAARQQTGLSIVDLWIGYIGLGGLGTPGEVEAMLTGELAVGNHERDVLAQALSERFSDLGRVALMPSPAGPAS